MISLGYHPIPDDLEAVLGRARFACVIVMDESIDGLYDAVDSVRTAPLPDAQLPAGLYWFDGLAHPLIMQVGTGPTGTSDDLALDVWDDAVKHPLAEALRWAEHLWDTGLPAPAPKFEVGDRALTVPAGADAEVRARTFDHGRWFDRVRGDGGLPLVMA